MELQRQRPHDLLLHRRQALRCRQAHGGLHPRRAQRPQRLDPADPLVRPPRLERAGGRPAGPLQERRRAARAAWRKPRGFVARPARCRRRRARGAGRPQLRLADRAGGGRARARARDAPGAGGHGLPDEGVAGLLEASLNEPHEGASPWSTSSRIRMLAPPPSALGPGTWLYGGSRALMRRVLASNREVNVFHRGFKACDSYAGGEAAMAAVTLPGAVRAGRAGPDDTAEIGAAVDRHSEGPRQVRQVRGLAVGHQPDDGGARRGAVRAPGLPEP